MSSLTPCPISGQPAMYGLGLRASFYLLHLSTLLLELLEQEYIVLLLSTELVLNFALLFALILQVAAGSLHIVEVYIIILLLSITVYLFIPRHVADLAMTFCPHLGLRIKTRGKVDVLGVLRGLYGLVVVGLQVWFWGRGVDSVNWGNFESKGGCRGYGFLFGAMDLRAGGMKALNILLVLGMLIGGLVVVGCVKRVRRGRRKALNEISRSRWEAQKWLEAMGGLAVAVTSIVAIELTIRWNRIGAESSVNQATTAAQLIPLLLVIALISTFLYGVFNSSKSDDGSVVVTLEAGSSSPSGSGTGSSPGSGSGGSGPTPAVVVERSRSRVRRSRSRHSSRRPPAPSPPMPPARHGPVFPGPPPPPPPPASHHSGSSHSRSPSPPSPLSPRIINVSPSGPAASPTINYYRQVVPHPYFPYEGAGYYDPNGPPPPMSGGLGHRWPRSAKPMGPRSPPSPAKSVDPANDKLWDEVLSGAPGTAGEPLITQKDIDDLFNPPASAMLITDADVAAVMEPLVTDADAEAVLKEMLTEQDIADALQDKVTDADVDGVMRSAYTDRDAEAVMGDLISDELVEEVMRAGGISDEIVEEVMREEEIPDELVEEVMGSPKQVNVEDESDKLSQQAHDSEDSDEEEESSSDSDSDSSSSPSEEEHDEDEDEGENEGNAPAESIPETETEPRTPRSVRWAMPLDEEIDSRYPSDDGYHHSPELGTRDDDVEEIERDAYDDDGARIVAVVRYFPTPGYPSSPGPSWGQKY
ncbi:hypothetical protein B0T21DRAFT_410268 [Apiosordaria backusii]|uniref:Uncharacterized protein n=1 Tax=Apiosordaria backusii TaxID=314023 RepID=A0AA40BT96_9PEZI|nr:hypothetical protein B0T21DRAFT_410268 [Apiosordaria backusii]